MLGILLSSVLLYKYVAIFIFMYVAGLLIPFPINTLTFAAGVFVSQGYLGFITTFIVALLGNVLGDVTGYGLTYIWKYRYVKSDFLEKVPLAASLERYVFLHARSTVFFSRFLGIIGSAVNFLSGLAKVPVATFILFDVLGNAVVIALFFGFGYYLGSFSDSVGDAMNLITGMILVTFAGIFISKYIQVAKKK